MTLESLIFRWEAYRLEKRRLKWQAEGKAIEKSGGALLKLMTEYRDRKDKQLGINVSEEEYKKAAEEFKRRISGKSAANPHRKFI